MIGKYLMAVDPGGTTGLAFRFPDGQIATCTTNSQEDLWQYFLDNPVPDQVILEEWQYFNGRVTPSGFLTANLVASLIGICHILKIPLALRSPGSRANRQQEAEEWYKQNKRRRTILKIHSHECDALAHLLTWESLHPELQRQVNHATSERKMVK